jgi:hypothetical protein
MRVVYFSLTALDMTSSYYRGNIHINKAHRPQDDLRIVILATLICNRKAYGVVRWN